MLLLTNINIITTTSNLYTLTVVAPTPGVVHSKLLYNICIYIIICIGRGSKFKVGGGGGGRTISFVGGRNMIT